MKVEGRPRPLGTAQRTVLHRMARSDGRWSREHGAYYENVPTTLVLLGSLVPMGLVEKIGEETYRLTHAGHMQTGMPSRKR